MADTQNEWELPEWKNEGVEPSSTLKEQGFKTGYKPPAGVFNWFFNRIINRVNELAGSLINTMDGFCLLDENVRNHESNKNNPHDVTAAQVGLDKVNNTSDAEKHVAFASEAGVGRKVQYPLSVRFNGGRTENTDLWTFDGATSKSINITSEKIGARPTGTPNIVVSAVRGTTADGKEVYTATDTNITELYNGLEITIIPNENNETLSPRLSINNLGDNAIRLALSFNCAATNALKTNFIQAGRPIKLKFDANCNLGTQGNGAWMFCDRQKTSAQDLYGTVPIESGGTDASTAEEARANLGLAKAALMESGTYVGDGTATRNITVNIKPALIVVSDKENTQLLYYEAANSCPATGSGSNTLLCADLEWVQNANGSYTVTISKNQSTTSDRIIMNTKDRQYYFIAFGS